MVLINKGDRKRRKRVFYRNASGKLTRTIRDRTSLNYQQLCKAHKDECLDVWKKILQFEKKGLIKREIIVRLPVEL